MATPRVRRNDANHDRMFGRGTANYASGSESTAQRVECFLEGICGEWFLDTARFLPWFAHPEAPDNTIPIMGVPRNVAYAEATVKAGILGVDGVTSIESFSMSFDSTTRKLSMATTVKDRDGNIETIRVVRS